MAIQNVKDWSLTSQDDEEHEDEDEEEEHEEHQREQEQQERREGRRQRRLDDEDELENFGGGNDDHDHEDEEADNNAADNNANANANANGNADVPWNEPRSRLAASARGDPFPTAPTQATLDAAEAAFRHEQSHGVCAEVTCASCDRLVQKKCISLRPLNWGPLRLLMAIDDLPQAVLTFYDHHTAANGLPEGLVMAAGGFVDDQQRVVPPANATQVQLCDQCHNVLQNGRRPDISLSNNNAPGRIPDELRVLTRREAQCVSKLVLRAHIHRIEK